MKLRRIPSMQCLRREAIRDAAGGSSDEAVNDFYANKIGDLVAQLQHAEGRAMYYKAEVGYTHFA